MLNGNRVQTRYNAGHRLTAQRLDTYFGEMHTPHLEDFQAFREKPGGVIVARKIYRDGAEPDQVECPSFAFSMCGIFPIVLDGLRIIQRCKMQKSLIPLPFLSVIPGACEYDFLLHLRIFNKKCIKLLEYILFLSLFSHQAYAAQRSFNF